MEFTAEFWGTIKESIQERKEGEGEGEEKERSEAKRRQTSSTPMILV